MKKVRLNILGLSYSQTQTGAYALILGEENGKRRLPVIIGTSEAQSIAIPLEGLNPYRPLTHDLFLSLATEFNIDIIEVNIVKLDEGIFYSELVCERDNAKIKIDSRTSDAIALALRFKCPIYAAEEIMKKAGIHIDEETGKFTTSEPKEKEDTLDTKSTDELEGLMKNAIEDEDYETASLIRDELKKREKSEEDEEK